MDLKTKKHLEFIISVFILLLTYGFIIYFVPYFDVIFVFSFAFLCSVYLLINDIYIKNNFPIVNKIVNF